MCLPRIECFAIRLIRQTLTTFKKQSLSMTSVKLLIYDKCWSYTYISCSQTLDTSAEFPSDWKIVTQILLFTVRLYSCLPKFLFFSQKTDRQTQTRIKCHFFLNIIEQKCILNQEVLEFVMQFPFSFSKFEEKIHLSKSS